MHQLLFLSQSDVTWHFYKLWERLASSLVLAKNNTQGLKRIAFSNVLKKVTPKVALNAAVGNEENLSASNKLPKNKLRSATVLVLITSNLAGKEYKISSSCFVIITDVSDIELDYSDKPKMKSNNNILHYGH